MQVLQGYYCFPQWPPLMVHPPDQYGLSGKIVGKGKYASVLWVLNPDRDTYYEVREAKTKSYAAKRAKSPLARGLAVAWLRGQANGRPSRTRPSSKPDLRLVK